MRTSSRLVALVGAASLIVAACGGSTPTASPPRRARHRGPDRGPGDRRPDREAPTARRSPTRPAWSGHGGIDDNVLQRERLEGPDRRRGEARHRGQVPRVASRDRLREEHRPVPVTESCDMIVTSGYLLGTRRSRRQGEPAGTRFAIRRLRLRPGDPERRGPRLHDERGGDARGLRVGLRVEDRRSWAPSAARTSAAGDRLHGAASWPVPTTTTTREGTRAPPCWAGTPSRGRSFTGDFEQHRQRQGPDGPGSSTRRRCHPAVSAARSAAGLRLPPGIGRPAYGIGVDVDWIVSVPPYTSTCILTCVLKKIDASVTAAIERAFNGEAPPAPVFVSTLANGGVDIAPFNDFESAISAEPRTASMPSRRHHLRRGEVEDYYAAK